MFGPTDVVTVGDSEIMNVISEFTGRYRFLSNFWMTPVALDGETYPSVEHAYQAAKASDIQDRKKIAVMATAGEAKRAGKTLAIRADWEAVKLQYMRYLVWTKFTTNRELRAKLLATGDARLIEGNTWGDTYWGVCNGRGENWLGKILEEVREYLKKTEPKDKIFVPGPNNIFVFGSNLAGIHGGGAAKTAFCLYGAVWGQGTGLQGHSYAIPTKDQSLHTLQLATIQHHILIFLQDAQNRPDLNFFVTRIGCGLAGYSDEDIAPLFVSVPPNCELPDGWEELARRADE